MADSTLILSITESTVRLSTPLILAALGGLYSERSGVINMALEGIMLAGAFTAAAVTAVTGNPWVGLTGAIVAGLLVAGIHAFSCIKCQGNQVVVGTAINILMFGVPPLVSAAIFESSGATPQLQPEQRLPVVPIVIAFLAVPLTHYVLYRTSYGLRLRAVGETPEAADTAGINVEWMRYSGVLISGILAAIGGAYLSIGQSSLYSRNMTAGRGYIALAALIFGNWVPTRVLLACLLFGFMDAAQIRLQGVTVGGVTVPTQFIQMLPYLFTIVVLAGFIGRSLPPQALGLPYVKERR